MKAFIISFIIGALIASTVTFLNMKIDYTKDVSLSIWKQNYNEDEYFIYAYNTHNGKAYDFSVVKVTGQGSIRGLVIERFNILLIVTWKKPD